MNRLKELRLKKNLTLDDIQEKIGIKRGTYNNYENGKTEPKLETWKKLANFFDVPLSYIQGENYSKEEIQTKVLKEINRVYFLNNYIYVESDTFPFGLERDLSQRVNSYLYILEVVYSKEPLEESISSRFKKAAENKEKSIPFDKEIFNNWMNIFSFLFENNNFLNWSKRDLDNKTKLNSSLIALINEKQELFVEANITKLGIFFLDTNKCNIEPNSKLKSLVNNKKSLYLDFEILQRKMLELIEFSGDKEKIIASIDSTINSLNNLKSIVENFEPNKFVKSYRK